MQVIRQSTTIDSDGHLRLDIPTQLSPGKIEVVLVVNVPEEKRTHFKKYDFSELAGKLSWKGDALEVQRALRDEW